MPIERLKTPPPQGVTSDGQLPSPPLTGSLNKRARPANDPEDGANKRSAIEYESRCPWPHEKDSNVTIPETSSDGTYDGKLDTVDRCSDVQGELSVQTNKVSKLVIQRPTAHARKPAPKTRVKPTNSSTPAAPSPPNNPPTFLTLPKPIRNRIYSHLGVLSSLICVRQNSTPSPTPDPNTNFPTASRSLLPGISFGLTLRTVDGLRARYAAHPLINPAILRVNKQVHAEAKAVMYSGNTFELAVPSLETSPPVDFTVPMFPRGYQRLVRRIVFRARALYAFRWFLSGGWKSVRGCYRGLECLTLVLELESEVRGLGKRLVRAEHWGCYVQRVAEMLEREGFGVGEGDEVVVVPQWVQIRVLFRGDAYLEDGDGEVVRIATPGGVEESVEVREREASVRRAEIKVAVAEAFDRFKKKRI